MSTRSTGVAHLAHRLEEGVTYCGEMIDAPTPWTIDGDDVVWPDDSAPAGRDLCAECVRRAGREV